ncbi:MAG: hypothetical protein KDJ90_19320 [Nitratireductor sp.]|nr:hypothetical protein [Nitratireductor sp.]
MQFPAPTDSLVAVCGTPGETSPVKEPRKPRHNIAPNSKTRPSARAIVRSGVRDPAHHVDPETLPEAGGILAPPGDNRTGGERHDTKWTGRASKTL